MAPFASNSTNYLSPPSTTATATTTNVSWTEWNNGSRRTHGHRQYPPLLMVSPGQGGLVTTTDTILNNNNVNVEEDNDAMTTIRVPVAAPMTVTPLTPELQWSMIDDDGNEGGMSLWTPTIQRVNAFDEWDDQDGSNNNIDNHHDNTNIDGLIGIDHNTSIELSISVLSDGNDEYEWSPPPIRRLGAVDEWDLSPTPESIDQNRGDNAEEQNQHDVPSLTVSPNDVTMFPFDTEASVDSEPESKSAIQWKMPESRRPSLSFCHAGNGNDNNSNNMSSDNMNAFLSPSPFITSIIVLEGDDRRHDYQQDLPNQVNDPNSHRHHPRDDLQLPMLDHNGNGRDTIENGWSHRPSGNVGPTIHHFRRPRVIQDQRSDGKNLAPSPKQLKLCDQDRLFSIEESKISLDRPHPDRLTESALVGSLGNDEGSEHEEGGGGDDLSLTSSSSPRTAPTIPEFIFVSEGES